MSFTSPGYGRPVDLHQWISADLTSIRTKLIEGVLRLVPSERWHEQIDGGGATRSGLALHLARHHDLAVNTVIRGTAPLFFEHADALELTSAGPAIGISEAENRSATAHMPPDALVRYATAVFDETAAWLPSVEALSTTIENWVAAVLPLPAASTAALLIWYPENCAMRKAASSSLPMLIHTSV